MMREVLPARLRRSYSGVLRVLGLVAITLGLETAFTAAIASSLTPYKSHTHRH